MQNLGFFFFQACFRTQAFICKITINIHALICPNDLTEYIYPLDIESFIRIDPLRIYRIIKLLSRKKKFNREEGPITRIYKIKKLHMQETLMA